MKQTVFQVRMDTQLKNDVEELYKELGTSFAEAVRIFAKQSLIEQGMPFQMKKKDLSGSLSKYADPSNVEDEAHAMELAMMNKHETNR